MEIFASKVELLQYMADRLAYLSDNFEQVERDDIIDMHCYVLDILNSLEELKGVGTV